MEQEWRADAHHDWRARGGMVNSTQAPEERENAPKGKVQSITDAKFPTDCSNRGSPGPSEKVATPATECEVDLLKGRRIVSNELKTKRRARENVGDENSRRKGETFTKAPSTGLIKEMIPAGAEKLDVRAPRESGGKNDTEIPQLLKQGQGNATEVNTAVRAAAQRTEDGFGGANTKGEAPANTPGMHSVKGHLKVSLGSGENDEVINIELAGVTEGVRGSKGNTRDGRAKSDSKTVNQKIEKKGRILPCAMPESTQGEETEPPRRTWDRVPQRKLARRCQRRPVTPKSKRRTRVASTQ